jgi:hypothetical protein
MPVRATMADIITAVRDLINDPAGASAKFTDQQIQDELDRARYDINYEELTPVDTITAAGQINYLQYASCYENWETDATLQGPSWEDITANTSSEDYLLGRWYFATHQAGPVFVVGKIFDNYKAAVALLEKWAAKEKLQFDFESNEQQFLRSQKIKMILEMARTYRGQCLAITVPMRRRDLNG